jgi:hypothetical protein
MKTNPILEEAWEIKDRLAAEAHYDIDRFVEQLRTWSAAHPPSGPVVRNAEELRQLTEKRERELTKQSDMALNDQPARKKD